jgi:hypothetical protein
MRFPSPAAPAATPAVKHKAGSMIGASSSKSGDERDERTVYIIDGAGRRSPSRATGGAVRGVRSRDARGAAPHRQPFAPTGSTR